MVARAMCVMYYGRTCARNRNEAGCYKETAQRLLFRCTTDKCKLLTVNFFMTYTICISEGLSQFLLLFYKLYGILSPDLWYASLLC